MRDENIEILDDFIFNDDCLKREDRCKTGKKNQIKIFKNKYVKMIISLTFIFVFALFLLFKYNTKYGNRTMLLDALGKMGNDISYFFGPLQRANILVEGNKTITGEMVQKLKVNGIDKYERVDFSFLDDDFIKTTNNNIIKYNYIKDNVSEQTKFDISVSSLDNNTFVGKYLQTDNNEYIYIDDTFKKYIKLDNKQYENINIKEFIDDIKNVQILINENLNNKVKNKNVKYQKVKLEIDGLEKELNKLTLALDYMDENFLKEDNIKEYIKKYILAEKQSEYLHKVDELWKSLVINAYYEKSKNGVSVLEIININNDTKLKYVFGLEEKYEYYKNDKCLVKVNVKKNNNKFIVNGVIGNEIIVLFDGEKYNDNYYYKWNIIDGDFVIRGNFNVTSEKNKSAYVDFKTFEFVINQRGSELFKYEFEIKNQYINSGNVNEEINDYLNYTELSDKEREKIKNKINNIFPVDLKNSKNKS